MHRDDLCRQVKADRLQGHTDRRGAVTDRFRGTSATRQLAKLALEHLAGQLQVDLVADVEGEGQVDDD